MASISTFKTQFGLGVRPNLFQVTLHYPNTINQGRTAHFLAKAAQLPASTLGSIDVPYRGRVIKVPGDRTFAEWTVTILNDEGFTNRNALEVWMNGINQHQANIQGIGIELYGSADVKQLNRSGGIIKTYEFVDIWPSEVAAVDLAFDTNDAVQEYTVTFQIQFWQAITTS